MPLIGIDGSLQIARFGRGVSRTFCVAALAVLAACAPTQERVAPPVEPVQPPPPEAAVPEAPAPGLSEVIREVREAREAEAARTKAAILLPLSGERASLGEAMLQAAQLALFDVADEEFDLIVRDTQGSAEEAEAAAQSALDAGADLILGPIFSASVDAVSPLARERDVPVLAFSNNRAVAGEGTFVLGLLPSQQVERILGYAASQGHSDFAVLAPDNAFGELVIETAEETVERIAGTQARTATYDPRSSDISDTVRSLARYDQRQQALENRRRELRNDNGARAQRELRRLRNADVFGPPPFDAVLIPVGGSALQGIAPLLPFYDVDPEEVQFLGTAEWNDRSLGREPALVGGWFPAPPPEAWRAFSERYRETFSATPPHLAALAYDATALAALLARQEMAEEDGNSPYTLERLTQRDGFSGVGGIFRLNPDGTAERRYAILEIERNALQQRDPAPESFRELLN